METGDYTKYKTIDLESLNLKPRIYNLLMRSGITTLEAFLSMSREDMQKIRNLGFKTLEEIINIKTQYLKQIESNNLKGVDSLENILMIKKITGNEDGLINFEKLADINILPFRKANISALYRRKVKNIYDYKKINKNKLALEDEYYIVERYIDNLEKFILEDSILKLTVPTILENCKFSKLKGFSKTHYFSLSESTILEVFNRFLADYDTIKQFKTVKDFNTFMLFYDFLNIDFFETNKFVEHALMKEGFTDQHYDVLQRRALNESLEHISKTYGVTRERIRQIEKAGIEKLSNVYKQGYLPAYIGFPLVMTEQNNTFLNDKYYTLIYNSADKIAFYKKIEANSKFVQIEPNCLAELDTKINKLYDYLTDNLIMPIKREEFKDINEVTLNYLLQKYNIEKTKNNFILNLTKSQKARMILNKYGLISIDTNNYNDIKQKLEDDYGMTFDNYHAMHTLFEKEGISIGEGKIISLEYQVDISEQILKEIKSEIEAKEFVRAPDLFDKFKNNLHGVINATHLYAILKRYFDKEFNFGGCNLGISIIGTPASKASRFYQRIVDKGSPEYRYLLCEEFSLDAANLAVTISQNEDIFRFGKFKIYLKSKIKYTENDRYFFEDFFKHNSHFAAKNLFSYILGYNNDFVSRNYITDMTEFYSVCDVLNLLCDYDFDESKKIYNKKQKTKVINEDDLIF